MPIIFQAVLRCCFQFFYPEYMKPIVEIFDLPADNKRSVIVTAEIAVALI